MRPPDLYPLFTRAICRAALRIESSHDRVVRCSALYVGRCRVSRGHYERIIAPSLYWEKWRCGGSVERAEIGTVRDKQRTTGEENNRGVERRALRGDY